MRDALHRWAVMASVTLALFGAAWRRSRRAKHRRQTLRRIEARWW